MQSLDRNAATRDPEDTRGFIVEQSMELFAHYGYSKTNIGDIAQACSMSAGNLYRYFRNKQAIGHAVVAAQSSVSRVTELHTHTMSEGMMKMRQVEKIEIPANGTTKLEPGGLHVMLIGLTQDLKPGDELSLTLTFEDGSSSRILVPVRMLQMMMKQDMGGAGHGKMNH